MMNIKEEVIIREYRFQDKDSILHLLRLNTPMFFSPEEEADLDKYLNYKLEYYFVLEIKNEIIGCGGINFSDDKTIGKISWDIIHPRFQGQGLGTLLLNYRIEKLKNIGSIKQITVRTSQLVYKFYEKSNFRIIEISKDYWAQGFDLYKMEYTEEK